MTRRKFLADGAGATATLAVSSAIHAQAKSPFKLSVITEEISMDFDFACSVAAKDFGMQWVELRGLWDKNIADLKDDDVKRAQSILTKYGLRVTDLASPLFKVDWPGAPPSKFSPKIGAKNDSFGATADFGKQDAELERLIELSKQFETEKIRCFDFWRLDDVTPYRAAIDDTLRKAAEKTKRQGIALVLENEHECNTVTAAEIARLMKAVPGLSLNWDPANAVMHGELDAFPVGFAMLPTDRILHCHCKNVARDAAGKLQWSPVDVGFIDWAAQFRALNKMDYRGAISLETHWRGAGTPEASSRVSWAGMKKELQASGKL